MFTARAFMCVYNELDIIPWTIKHLISQGVCVTVIDNWSTDGSYEYLCSLRDSHQILLERFPESGPSQYYSWKPLLERVEILAQQSDASWCIHHDADEIRRSYLKDESLIFGLERVDKSGYTAINHRVYHFMPTDDSYIGDPERHFRYYSTDGINAIRQIKAWKNMNQRVCLSRNGGHCAEFNALNVYPEKFILKHYPLRTSSQSARKVLAERMSRYDPAERANGWHVQYNTLAQTQSWIHDPKDLTRWDENEIFA